MKYFIFLSIFILMIGCQPEFVKTFEKQSYAYGVDFTPYSELGFMFTPLSYDGKYNSIGIVRFTIKSGAKYEKPLSLGHVGKFKYGKVNAEEILDMAYLTAKAMGADAIINFKIEQRFEKMVNGNHLMEFPVIDITGFAIKRAEK